jgi:stage IV sporulation protein FB
MGWEDRQHWSATEGRGGGGFRSALRRIFGEGDNPLAWSLPLYTLWGIRVRVHIIFVIMAAAELIRAAFGNPDSWGPGYVAIGMGSLFVLVLLHEYGHCFACRWVGGEADQILMWPLGGLAYCRPPHEWRAALVTTLGGPMVNVVLTPVLAGLVYLLTHRWGAVLFNPFDPWTGFQNLVLASTGKQPYWLVAIWWLHYTNLALLAFNTLLVMYPMDSGRVLQEILWSRIGHQRSLAIAAKFGLGMAVVVGMFAVFFNVMILLGIAIFCGFTCYLELKNQQFARAAGEFPGYDFDRGFAGMPGAEDEQPSAPSRAELKRRERAKAEQAEVDRILEKIARTGMGSLTSKEKKALGQATDRRRRE